jgi:hypothetical protein
MHLKKEKEVFLAPHTFIIHALSLSTTTEREVIMYVIYVGGIMRTN